MAVQRDDASNPTSSHQTVSGRGEDDLRARAGREDAHLWELVRFLPEIIRLLGRVVRDPRVPVRSKIMTAGVLAYVVSPVDVIPDFIPFAGQMDDLAMVMWGLRRLLQTAGYDVLRDLWSGSDDGFVALLVVVGVED